MFNRVLVSFDGSKPAQHALYAGIQVCRQDSVQLHVVTYLETTMTQYVPGYPGLKVVEMVDSASLRLKREFLDDLESWVRSACQDAGVEVHLQRIEGFERDRLINAIGEADPDLFVVGTTPDGFVSDPVTASLQDLVNQAGCSLLCVR